MSFVLSALILAAIVFGVVALVRRSTQKGLETEGGDLLVYVMMALFVGGAVFSLVFLGQAAFPGGTFVFNPERQVAASLAGLVVAGPVAFLLWRRQSRRRAEFPSAPGWTAYLTLIEAVFMTAFVTSLFTMLNWIMGDGAQPPVTDLIIYAGVIAFHEWVVARTPPGSDSYELPRVVGSAIGLIATTIGLGGLLIWVFTETLGSIEPTVGGPDPFWALSMLIAGLPVWWYRWLRPWPGELTSARAAWTSLVTTAGLVTAVGSATYTGGRLLELLVTDANRKPIIDDFPITLGLGITALLVWWHHRRRLGKSRTDAVRAYEYLSAGFGFGAAILAGIGLTVLALEPGDVVAGGTTEVIMAATTAVAGALLWGRFWRRAQAQPRAIEAASLPRRFYLLGLGVATALAAAGGLIATLVFVFQRLLGVGDRSETVVATTALFVFAGAAAWHLLRQNARDRELLGAAETVAPFDVTVICSHPGMLAAKFPKVARIRVLYREDDLAVIDDDMADEIVAQVGTRSSLVWVDGDGFRVSAMRRT